MRADAVKNRQRILDAAETVFAAEGVSVPIDMVAEEAGLGVGTLYRHFPNKEALFEAIVIERLGKLLAAAEVARAADDPGSALFAFLLEFSKEAAAKRDLFDALGTAGIDIKAYCSDQIDELMRNVELLLERAVQAGAVRDDLQASEVVGLIVGTCHAAGSTHGDDAALERMVGVVLDGLRR